MDPQVHVSGLAGPLQFLPLHILADAGVTDFMALLKQIPMDVGALQALLAHPVIASAVILFQPSVNLFRHRAQKNPTLASPLLDSSVGFVV